MRVLVLGNGSRSLQLAHIISDWKEYTVEGIVDYQNKGCHLESSIKIIIGDSVKRLKES